MSTIALKEIKFGGVKLSIPEVWNVITEAYIESDGRECSMIDISAKKATLDRPSSATSQSQRDPMPSWRLASHMRNSSERSA